MRLEPLSVAASASLAGQLKDLGERVSKREAEAQGSDADPADDAATGDEPSSDDA